MNTSAIKFITTAVKVLSILGGLAAYSELIPAKFAGVAVIVFGLASAAKDMFVKTGDLLDDGKSNGSYRG